MEFVDPVVWFFGLGLLGGLLRADLRLPAAIYEFLVMFLLLTIGLKGGVELAQQSLFKLIPQLLAIALMGAVMPLIAFPILRIVGRLTRIDAASIAAHYGSVSVGTFAVGVAYLSTRGIAYEAQMPVFVVILEIPAIAVGIVLAHGISRKTDWRLLAREVLLGKSIVMLLGGLCIGWIAGPVGVAPLAPFFFDLFKGVLALFLLEMGLIAANEARALVQNGLFLFAFGVLMPLIGAVIGTGLGYVLGLSVGGTMLLATLAASASYIAVPAAMRLALPAANPSLSLTLSLGVTFPFNIFFGIPIYERMSQILHSFSAIQ